MKVSYNGLWKLLIDNNMKKKDLIEKIDISSATLAKIQRNLLFSECFVYLQERKAVILSRC